MECCGPRHRVPIYSINYDFSPTIPYSQKVLWIQLRDPAPPSLRIGDLVRMTSSDRYYNPPSREFRVVDIVGTRVSLSSKIRDVYAECLPGPFEPGFKRTEGWHPWNHGWQWGYATRDMSDYPYADRNWTYGNGRSISYLEW